METDRTRTHTWQDPHRGAEEGLKMSGMDYLTAMTQGTLPFPPLLSTLDYTISEIFPGKVTFTMEPKEFHYNPIGSVHGGVIAALLDSAMGCSLHTQLPKGTGYTTLELKVNFLRPTTLKTGLLTCVGKIIHAGSRIAMTEAQIHDPQEKLIAHATSTLLLMPVS